MLFDRLKETRSLLTSLQKPYWLGSMPGHTILFSELEKTLRDIDSANRVYDTLQDQFNQGLRPPSRLNNSDLETAKQQLKKLHVIVAGCGEVRKTLEALKDAIAPQLWLENLQAGGMALADAKKFVDDARTDYAHSGKTMTLDAFLHAAAAQGAVGEGEYVSKAYESKAWQAVREFMEGRLPREVLANPTAVINENNALLRSTVLNMGLDHAELLMKDLSGLAQRNITYLTNKWPKQLGHFRDMAPQRST